MDNKFNKMSYVIWSDVLQKRCIIQVPESDAIWSANSACGVPGSAEII